MQQKVTYKCKYTEIKISTFKKISRINNVTMLQIVLIILIKYLGHHLFIIQHHQLQIKLLKGKNKLLVPHPPAVCELYS